MINPEFMSKLHATPHFSPEEAAEIARNHFGLDGFATPLASERDQNFRIETKDGRLAVLKIANATDEYALLEAQQRAMQHAAANGCRVPDVVPALSGEMLCAVHGHWVWCITWMDGKPLGTIRRQTAALRTDWGQKLGQLTRALLDFDHPALRRSLDWDLANGLSVIERHLEAVQPETLRELIQDCTAHYKTHTVPKLPRLRTSAIHNDANDYNVLAGGGNSLWDQDQQLTAILDFGDLVHSHTVNEVAIAAAYACLGQEEPLDALADVLKGFHETCPLTEDEVSVFFDLVRLRLCVSACMAAHQQALRPNDPYLSISQMPIRRTLPQLAAVHPRFAEAVLRQACGFTPIPQAQTVVSWLRSVSGMFSPVLTMDLSRPHVLDLGVESALWEGDDAQNTADALTVRIETERLRHQASVAIGQYDEVRLIYTAPFFATGHRVTDERRCVHLGLDLFAPAGTPVLASLRGTLHASAFNPQPQDYGGVLLLRHQTDDGTPFYTLYGHLSRMSLENKQIGQTIQAGEVIGFLGDADENVDWPPHLHFQIITDDLDLKTDFAGVGTVRHREVWKNFSPNPNLITGIPATVFPPKKPSKDETLIQRKQYFGGNLSLGYREPVKVLRGWMQYLYDESGRRYLDAYNNVPHVGHSHPEVLEAACGQMRLLNTNTRYLHDAMAAYAEALTATLPAPLSVCYFVNSASEANELALRLIRAYTGRRDLIVMEGAYHGNTTGLIDISPYKHNGPGGNGAPDWVHTVPIPDVYRGAFKADDPLAATRYAQHVQTTIDRLQATGRMLGGWIAETCPSVGGQIVLPDGYLAQVYAMVRKAGGLCVADEVQTGYGRIGTHFWAFEAHHVVPDLVVMGKPIGNGHPIGAVVTTRAIADAFDNGMEYFSTFGGNPVSAVVGRKVLEITLRDGLMDHAKRVGETLLTGLRKFSDHPLVGDVRGSGLFLGMELVRDRQTRLPADAEASYVSNRMREYGILMGTDGPLHNVVKIRPPMPFSAENATLLLERMKQILHELGE